MHVPGNEFKRPGPSLALGEVCTGGMPNADVYSGSLDASGNVVLTGDLLSPGIIFGHDTLVNHGLLNFYTVKFDSGETCFGQEVQAALFPTAQTALRQMLPATFM